MTSADARERRWLRLRHRVGIVMAAGVLLICTPFVESAVAFVELWRSLKHEYKENWRAVVSGWKHAGWTQEEIDAEEMAKIRATFPPSAEIRVRESGAR